MKKINLFLVIILTFSSCISTMKVKVDVIDRTKLIVAPEVLLMEVLAISEIEETRLKNQFYQNQRADIIGACDKLFTKLVRSKRLAPDVYEAITKDLQQEIDGIYLKQVIPILSEGVNDTKAIFLEKLPKDASLSERQLNLLYKARSNFSDARKTLNDFISKWTRLEPEWMEAVKEKLNKDHEVSSYFFENIIAPQLRANYKIDSKLDHLEAFHNGLFGDPLNAIVIQAPNDYWKKIYNKTVAKNLLGNTDIAVVMETPGNFFIKGVRMDAENVTSTLAKTFNSSIKLLGKVNGIEFTPTGSIDTTAQIKKKSFVQDKIDTEELEQEIEIREKITKLSFINLMDAVIMQKDSLQSESGYQEALQQIQSIYQVHKSQLETLQKN